MKTLDEKIAAVRQGAERWYNLALQGSSWEDDRLVNMARIVMDLCDLVSVALHTPTKASKLNRRTLTALQMAAKELETFVCWSRDVRPAVRRWSISAQELCAELNTRFGGGKQKDEEVRYG